MKLLDLSRPMAVLQELGREFPMLPAPHIDLNDIYPSQIRLAFHKSLGDFEAWREALSIDPAAVRQTTQSGDMTLVLHASATRGDVLIELIAYGPNPAMLLQAVA
ncbi:hypothetical protein N4G70_29255 [Streptomyces sp. ASQP_92]|uniref:hypothetical protein n=1 Tax=Streptomyces sp. ASQP_92 TaxID=2979116 RepID=UPI0021C23A76|nr:hypothetical protein [Streptomyces sp. ASQP_92]MCT9092929.1 hypothetical protein [Streptomyces sp. ASQP_92]